jgi:hypothetical protein
MRDARSLGAWVLATAFVLAPAAGAQTRSKTPAKPAPAGPASPGQPQQGLDRHAKEALQKTQALLRDPAARAETIKADPKARAANGRAEAVARSPKNTQRMYEISADVLETVAVQGQGDPERMNKIVEAAGRDPAAFLQSLPPEQRAAIQQLAAELAREHPELAGQAAP